MKRGNHQTRSPRNPARLIMRLRRGATRAGARRVGRVARVLGAGSPALAAGSREPRHTHLQQTRPRAVDHRAPARARRPDVPAQQPLVRPRAMSNETTFTRRAGAALLARVYAQPTTQSRRVGRLRFLTEDGFPEVCVLLAERADGAGISWVQLRLPQPPNNVTGGVRRSALGPFHVVHMRLVVNRSALRITLFKRGGGDSAHASAWARPARRRRPATSVSARIPCQRQHAVRRTGDGHGGVIGIQGDRSARTDPLRIALDPPDGELRTGAVAPRRHDRIARSECLRSGQSRLCDPHTSSSARGG
jgi:hypothetical protein